MAFNFKIPASFKKEVPTSETDGKESSFDTKRVFSGSTARLFGGTSLFPTSGGTSLKRERVTTFKKEEEAESSDGAKPKSTNAFSSGAFRGRGPFGASLTASSSSEGVNGPTASVASPFGGNSTTADQSKFKWRATKREAGGGEKPKRKMPMKSSGDVPKAPDRGIFAAPARLSRIPPTVQSAMKWTRKAAEDEARSRSASPAAQEIKEEKTRGFPSTSTSQRDTKPSSFGHSPVRSRAAPAYTAPVGRSSHILTRDQTAVLTSLFQLHGRSCPSDYDRYILLDERDKLLCKWRAEQERLDFPHTKGKSRTVAGECAAMCSEKERYMRETQKRISNYEYSNGHMDTSRLVKEYARSAADQEKPLAHELRTRDFLETSMAYLLTEILDKMPENEDELAGWYDFLWSRTRAIRKEVTQLMLSDEVAVALVERCTRLHIVCAYLLCPLEVEKFDQKMNTENLGKCLQTLRHLYDDLDRRGIHCETEAEFRAYDVMLHLHDSNVLRQVLSYRKEVRESRPVRLAIQIAGALQNNNYVRFFRLLKSSASFLQCCICHRFFQAVRGDALCVMVNSFGRNSLFSLDKMVSILALDAGETALNELAAYGIRPNDMEHSQVVLTRDEFARVNEHPLMRYNWIGSKRAAPLSQTVHGPGTIPQSLPSFVSDSFDENGCYSRDPVLLKLLSEHSAELPSISQTAIAQLPPVRAAVDPLQPYNQWMESEVDAIIAETIQTPVNRVAEKVFTEHVAESLLKIVADSILKSVVLSAYTEGLRISAEEKRKQDADELRRQTKNRADEMAEAVLVEIVDKQLQSIARAEKDLAVRQYTEKAADWLAERMWDSRVLPAIDRELKHVIKKMLKHDQQELDDGLNRFRDRMYVLWLRQFWDTWRAKVVARREFRRKRAAAWQQFTPVWDSPLFSADVYLKKTSPSSLPRDGRMQKVDIRTSVQIAEFRKRRQHRILSAAFLRWKEFVTTTKHRRKLERLMQHQSRMEQSSLLRQSKNREESRDSNFSGRSSNRLNRRRLPMFEPDTPVPVPRKAARLSLAENYPFLHPDDSVFQTPAPGKQKGVVHSSVVQSTPLSWHSDVQFCPQLSQMTESTCSTTFQPFSTDMTLLPANSILTQEDLSYARSHLSQTNWNLTQHRKKPAPVTTQVSDSILDESKTLLEEAIGTNNSISSFEHRAKELEEKMRTQQNVFDRLLQAESRKRRSL